MPAIARSTNHRLIGGAQDYQPMFPINVRMSEDMIDTLEEVANDQHRTLRGLIRHILWTQLAKQGYLPTGAA